jgi:enterochelin esterase-like enzyme
MRIKLFMAALMMQLLCINNADAQAPVTAQEYVIGQKISLPSKILDEARDIQIYLPPSYESGDKSYPVLYILDGQRLFFLGVSVAQTFTSQFQVSPDFIVVGINNSYPQRFSHLGSTKFMDFIEKELVSYIDKSYRTTDERIIFGWEYAGAFAIESMIDRPHLFDGHIAASPYPLNVAGSGLSKVQRLAAKLKGSGNDTFESFLHFAVSDNEQRVIEGTGELNELLKKQMPKKLNWQYRVIEGEEHRSTAYAALYQGLKSYFKYFPELAISTLKEFEQLGGMDYVYHYNKTRAKQFGFSAELQSWSMFGLVRAAIRADDFVKFEFFMDIFAKENFITQLQFRRTFQIADFYVTNNKPKAALALYIQLLDKNAESARLHNAMGDVYVVIKDTKKALVAYQKAVALATKQKDAKLVEYQKNLDELLKG